MNNAIANPPLPINPAAPRRAPRADELREIETLYEAGRILDAYRRSERFAPMSEWPTAAGLVLASRLADNLGGPALSSRLAIKAHRLDPADLEAAYFCALARWGKHGAWEALQFMERFPLPDVPNNVVQAHCWLLRARVLSLYRDFPSAEAIGERVLGRFPTDAWCWVERSYLFEREDRYDEALEAAERACDLRPWYRPAVHARAHMLQLLNRDAEAIELLEAATKKLQSGSLVQMLVLALDEHGRYEEILPLLDRVAELLPLAGRAERDWIASRRCDAAHRTGRHGLALQSAQVVDNGYYRQIAARLSLPEPRGKRVLLSVGFVRQHHQTCSPATLAAISRYWGVPAEQAEIARRICYNGSPDHEERNWAEAEGWCVREFRADWRSARALLDRGCPFGIVTVDAESAHMQAVIGYDATVETLQIRDPYQRTTSEWDAAAFFRVYAAHGPRAIVFVPGDRAELIEQLELPDAALYDLYHRVRRGLHLHDRDAAGAAFERLRELAPRHLLTHRAGSDLANYDGNPGQALEFIRQARREYPDDYNWRLAELSALDRVGLVVERRALLAELGAPRRAAPFFRRSYAEELLRDARTRPRARRMVRSILRQQAVDARNLRLYADLLGDERAFEAATSVHRLAATLGDKEEWLWHGYFTSARQCGRTDECLTLLRDRFARWGAFSSQPARTLFNSLDALDQTEEGFEVLEEACRLRPDDGGLMLFAAEAYGRSGRFEDAARLLDHAAGKASRATWLRSAARLAGYRADVASAREYWHELHELNPEDADTLAALARAVSQVEGRAAAIVHLENACRRFPHHLPIHRLLVEWLRQEPQERALEAVDRLLGLDPVEVWAWREKALVLRRLVRLNDALQAADEAVRIAPLTAASHGVRGDVLLSLGRRDEAHAAYRAALRHSIDADWLFDSLISSCPDFPARRAAVDFLHEELLRQVSVDNACLQFRSSARAILPPDELTARLRAIHQARPGNWSTWSVLALHLTEAGELDEALALARECTERFPLLPRVWLDLARVHAARHDPDAEIAAAERALAINPSWGLASRHLSGAHEKRLQLDRATHVLERAIAADPTEGVNYCWLADVLWRRQERERAVATLKRGLQLRPDYDWGWHRLEEWAKTLDQPELTLQLAADLVRQHAGEPSTWMRLANIHFNDPMPDEALAAIDRATRLDPASADPWDLRAQLLVNHRRFDEASASCRPACFGEHPPHFLLGRAAWVEYRRGNPRGAIEAMTKLVAQHPDYLWGWIQLTEWNDEQENWEEARVAAEKWAWLAPEAASPHGFLGALHKRGGRRADAKLALGRALARDPQYRFGAFELLDLHLADREFEAVQKLIEHIGTHFTRDAALNAMVRLHLRRGDVAPFRQALTELALQPSSAAERLRDAVDRAIEQEWASVTEETLRSLLRRDDSMPETGACWFKTRADGWLPVTLWRLRRRGATETQRAHAFGALVAFLGDHRRTWRLRFVCRCWRAALHRHDESWSQVGYAFTAAGLPRLAVRWLGDWSRRVSPPEVWILHNLMFAHYSLGQTAAALAVLEKILELPAAGLRERHLVFRACEHALAGETASAQAQLVAAGANERSDFHRGLLEMTRAMVETQSAPPEQRRELAQRAARTVKSLAASNLEVTNDPALRHFYRRTLRRLAKDGGLFGLRVRSMLPIFTRAAPQAASGQSVPLWLIWIAIVMLSSAARSCSQAGQ